MSGPPDEIELFRVRVPLRTAHRSAHVQQAERDSVLVRVRTSDGLGWGECPTLSEPGYATETTDEAWAALRDVLVPALLEGRPLDDVAVRDVTDAHPASVGALRDAVLDERLRHAGRSLRVELGAAETVAMCGVVAAAGDTPSRAAAAALELAESGVAMVKVKITPGHDLEVIDAVRRAVDGLPVAADANGSYRLLGEPEERRRIEDVDRMGLAYLEQPFEPDTPWDHLRDVRDALRTPMALDESITSFAALDAALEATAVDVVSIKPARLGGVLAAADAVRRCVGDGVDAFVGGMFELGVGRAAAAAVAGMDGCTLPTDLGPSARYVDDDVTEPVVTDGRGRLLVPDSPGIGREPSDERLDEFTVDHASLLS